MHFPLRPHLLQNTKHNVGGCNSNTPHHGGHEWSSHVDDVMKYDDDSEVKVYVMMKIKMMTETGRLGDGNVTPKHRWWAVSLKESSATFNAVLCVGLFKGECEVVHGT